jgi:hypothetical protein
MRLVTLVSSNTYQALFPRRRRPLMFLPRRLEERRDTDDADRLSILTACLAIGMLLYRSRDEQPDGS